MSDLRLSPRQHQALVSLVTRCSTPQLLAQRGRLILSLDRTQSVTAAANECGVSRPTAWKWRSRWLEHQAELEALPARKMAKRLPEVLADAPRPGPPPTFDAAQIAQLIAMACESPQAAGLPISHWTITALAEEAVRRGIVESISRRTVWRFLKSGRPEAAPGPTVAQSA